MHFSSIYNPIKSKYFKILKFPRAVIIISTGIRIRFFTRRGYRSFGYGFAKNTLISNSISKHEIDQTSILKVKFLNQGDIFVKTVQ